MAHHTVHSFSKDSSSQNTVIKTCTLRNNFKGKTLIVFQNLNVFCFSFKLNLARKLQSLYTSILLPFSCSYLLLGSKNSFLKINCFSIAINWLHFQSQGVLSKFSQQKSSPHFYTCDSIDMRLGVKLFYGNFQVLFPASFLAPL